MPREDVRMEAKDWRELFTVEQAEKPFHFKTEAGECNSNCQLAKEIKCVCRCGGKNHGAALKQHVKRLDEFTERDTSEVPPRPAETYEDPVVFNPEEYREELAVLA
jgi:hypothetical protein